MACLLFPEIVQLPGISSNVWVDELATSGLEVHVEQVVLATMASGIDVDAWVELAHVFPSAMLGSGATKGF